MVSFLNGLIFSFHFFLFVRSGHYLCSTLTNKNRPDGRSVVMFFILRFSDWFLQSQKFCLLSGDVCRFQVICCVVLSCETSQQSKRFSKPASSSRYPCIQPLNDAI
ncbi:hypothetical protein N657DRAFT_26167 [Parathielavia appendiculata]|uniref:Secreted protein n=1 Tax=Parathielavia appendiculata TaxID=2587402 RepID=A0AAN6U8P6_9PEZI|nr:hypothetical protein N657DRAFT_26167 [Parathielavia appendiculata]